MDSQHLGRLSLSPGTLASTSLQPVLNRKKQLTRLEWAPAVVQREDLRLHSRDGDQSSLVHDRTISTENDEEMLDFEGDRLEFVKDDSLLQQTAHLLPTTPLNPTILLRALTADRGSTSRKQTEFLPANPNFGNCLTTSTLASTSYAFFRRGDEFGRGTQVGWARVGGAKSSAKGKERAWEEDEEAGEEAGEGRRGEGEDDAFWPAEDALLSEPTTTPILQLQAAPLAATNSTLLAARTHTTLALHTIKHEPSSLEPPIVSSYEYTGRDLGRRSIADAVLGGVHSSARQGEGMVVDVDGGVYGWGLAGASSDNTGRPGVFRLRKGVKEKGYSGMVRVAYGGARGADALVAFEDSMLLYDLRSPKASSELVTAAQLAHNLPPGRNRSPSLLTSLCTPSSTSLPSHLQPVCTTREVMLIDDRMPGRDVLRWKHGRLGKEGRGFDRSLRLMEVPDSVGRGQRAGEGVRRVALHSRLHPAVGVHTFDGESQGQGSSRSLLDPYALGGGRRSLGVSAAEGWTRNGIAFVSTEEGWTALESAVDGAVYTRLFTRHARPSADGPIDIDSRPSSSTPSIGAPIPELVPTVGNKQQREPKLLDLTRTQHAIFNHQRARSSKALDKQELKARLERAEGMLVRAVEEEDDLEGEGGAPGILTAFDLLVLARETKRDGEEDEEMDVKGEEGDRLALPRPSTFRGRARLAAATSGLQQQSLAEACPHLQHLAPWSTSLLPADGPASLPHTDELLTSALSTMAHRAELLRQRYEGHTSATQDTSTAAACSQIVLDTTLSSLLLSTRSVRSTAERRRETRSNEPFPGTIDPPPLEFAYFRPRAQPKRAGFRSVLGINEEQLEEEEDDEHEWRKPNLRSVGVRMLLAEWDLGEDPHDYAWSNPYADDPAAVADSHFQSQSHSQTTRNLNVPPKFKFKGTSPSPAPLGAGRPFASAFGSSQPPAFQSSQLPTVREERGAGSRAVSFAASQPAMGMGAESQTQVESQGLGAATQVVPGQWGGRAVAAKDKKKQKKRVSGF